MKLSDFFKENNKVALAFSGGVDSSYLLYAAVTEGIDVKAYYVKSAFQPEFEYQDALRLTKELGAKIRVLNVDVFVNEDVLKNPKNRCYYCKNVIFGRIKKAAAEDGYSLLLDGTNASDDVADRPGMKALEELQVKSPLRLCGLTKQDVRRLSKEAGLFTYNKPSYACLATRIPTGTRITKEALETTEAAESYMAGLGFKDFRVRMRDNGTALIQLKSEQLPLIMEKRKDILSELEKYYKTVSLDLAER